MQLVATVLSLATMLVFLASAARNLHAASRDAVPAALRRLGINSAMLRLAGALELTAAVGLLAGLLYPPFGLAAAGGLVLLMLAALSYHLRAEDIKGALTGPAGPPASQRHNSGREHRRPAMTPWPRTNSRAR